MSEIKPWYKNEWWYAVLYAVFVLLNHFLGLGLDVASLIALILPIIAIIFGDKWVEIQKLKVKELELQLKILDKKSA